MSNDLVQEQTAPKPSDGDVWLLVLSDMEERRKHGIEKYGTPVQPFNGRDALVDSYQEALDLCVYLRQAIEERNKRADGLIEIRKIIENGEEWSKMDAGSLHLLVVKALGQ